MNGIEFVLVLILGGCFGGLIMNDLCWRQSRKEAARLRADSDAMFADLRADYAKHDAKWDAEMATLKEDSRRSLADIDRWRDDQIGWCRALIAEHERVSS